MLIAEHPDDADMIRAYRQHWPEMMPGQIDETVAIFDELLAAGHDVTALTNFADDTFEEARARFPLLDRFRGSDGVGPHPRDETGPRYLPPSRGDLRA